MHTEAKELYGVFDLLSDDNLEQQTLEQVSSAFKSIHKKKDALMMAAYLVFLYHVEDPRLLRARALCILYLLWELFHEPNFLRGCPYVKLFYQALGGVQQENPAGTQTKSVFDVPILYPQERRLIYLVTSGSSSAAGLLKQPIHQIFTQQVADSDLLFYTTPFFKELSSMARDHNTPNISHIAIPNILALQRRDFSFVQRAVSYLRQQQQLLGSWSPPGLQQPPGTAPPTAMMHMLTKFNAEEKKQMRDQLVRLFLQHYGHHGTPAHPHNISGDNGLMPVNAAESELFCVPQCMASAPPSLHVTGLKDELTWLEPSGHQFELAWDYSIVGGIDNSVTEGENLRETLTNLRTVSLNADSAENVKRLFQALANDPYLIREFDVQADWIPKMVETNPGHALNFILLIGYLRNVACVHTGPPEEVKLFALHVHMHKTELDLGQDPLETEEHTQLRRDITQLFMAMLDVLIHMRISIHSVEVLNRLHYYVVIEPDMFIEYAKSGVAHLVCEQDKIMQMRLIRIWCVFIQSLVRNRFLDYDELMPILEQFCVDFTAHKEAANLYRLLKTCQESSNKERDPLKK